MDAEPPSPSPGPSGGASDYPPADFARRVTARLCDLALAAVPFALLLHSPRLWIAALGSAALLLCGDRLFGPGRSFGKRLAGLRVIVLATRQPSGITASMRRNALFALAVLPAASGSRNSLYWAAAAIVGVATIETAVALARLTSDLGRRRLGDLLAGTQVIDASIALGLTERDRISLARAQAAAISATPRHAARRRLRPDTARNCILQNPAEEPECASP